MEQLYIIKKTETSPEKTTNITWMTTKKVTAADRAVIDVLFVQICK